MRLTEETALYTQNHFLWSLWNWKCAWPLIGYFKSEEMIEDILSTARRHKLAAQCTQRLESSENMSLTSICKLSRFLKSTRYTFNTSKGMCIRVSSEGYRHGGKAGSDAWRRAWGSDSHLWPELGSQEPGSDSFPSTSWEARSPNRQVSITWH